MARIQTYQSDQAISSNDLWIGTDGDNSNKTKNFSPVRLAQYFNASEGVNKPNSITFKYQTLDPGESREPGTISFSNSNPATINFSAITSIMVSKRSLGLKYVDAYLSNLNSATIIIHKGDSINNYGVYIVSSIVENALDTNFFDLNISFIQGNNGLEEDKEYILSVIDFAQASSSIPDATTTLKGKIKLAGDLGGTADLPTVPALEDKVDKVAGKGLSTEDYTTAEKDKLAGIQVGAEVNVNADWNATSGDAQILNKPSIPSISGLATESYVDSKVEDTIVDGVTTKAPSQNAVFDALATKQALGDYITELSGEATAEGPGNATVTLNNSAVTGKVLTGVNITGGSIAATDTMLTAFGKIQNQINGLVGGSIYQGVWNANTNTPSLTSSVGTNGHYYVVNVAGSTNLNGITDWKVGDWAIFAGTSWQKVDNTDAVVSVNGFTGAVSLTTDNISEGSSNLYFTNARARGAVSLTTTGTSGSATYNSSTGVFNIPTYTLSGLGGQPLLTNPITGTGTTNFLPKFTGASALGNSLIYDNGTNVGINITSPSEKLHVGGNGLFSGNVSVSGFVNSGSGINNILLNAGNLDFYNASAANKFIRVADDSSIVNAIGFSKSGPSATVWFPNGNVGIGTTSPSEKFDVNGVIKSSNDIISTNGTISSILAHSSAYGAVFGSTTNHNANIYTNSLPRVTVTTAGNVGIGTTSPSGKLHVVGGSTTTSISNAATTVNARFDVANPAVSLGIGYVSADIPMIQSFNNGTNAAVNLTINPFGGNVGIGSTSPAEKLDVNGNIKTGALLITGSNFYSGIGNQISSAYGVNDYVTANYATTGNMIMVTNATEAMRITSGGNVGIGTTSPTSKLHVNSSSSTEQFLISRSEQTNQGFSIKAGAGKTEFNSFEGTNSVFGNYIFNSTKGSTTATRMVIDASGNVGIGTSDPKSKLHVVGFTEHATNAAAIAGGLTVGAFYHTAGVLKVVI
jgi:hypothetical protein